MNLRIRLEMLRQRVSEVLSRPNKSDLSLDLKIAAFFFRHQRADYYFYLADMIEGSKGRMLLRDIFAADAARYGKSARGKLSNYWMRTFEDGGKFCKTFAGTLPEQDVAVLVSLQQANSQGALESGLRDLADNTALAGKARQIAILSMSASLICITLLLAFILSIPIFLVPQIQGAFSMLPPDRYPENAQSFFAFGTFVTNHWLNCLVLVAGFVTLVIVSLPNLTGAVRLFLDRYGLLWGMYRDFQSIRLISGLSTMIRTRGNKTPVLKAAISLQLQGSSRWKKHHIQKMLDMVDRGEVGPPLFETGILDRQTAWYIGDLIHSRGIEDALQFVRDRLENRVISRLSIQTTILNWGLMISGIMAAIFLMLWIMGHL